VIFCTSFDALYITFNRSQTDCFHAAVVTTRTAVVFFTPADADTT